MQSISYSSCWIYIMSTSKSSMVNNGLITKVDIFDLFFNRLSSSILRDRQLKFIFCQTRHGNFHQTFLYFGCHFRIRIRIRSSIVHRAFIRRYCIFWYTISKHFKWIMTCSSPRRTFFLHMLSFECTSNLCGTFLNQFSDYFHILKMHYTI